MANAAITVDLNAKIAQFETELKKATGSLDKFGRKGDQIAAGFKTAFGALAASVSVGMFVGFIKGSIDAQDAISKLSQKTGIAVDSLAGLQHAADLSDVGVDQLAKGIRTLGVVVDESERGMKSYQDKLSMLGLDYKKLKDLTPEEQFYALADAVSKLSKEDRAVAVAGALGDKMTALVPLLSGGSVALRQMVEEGKKYNPVTAESARQAEEFNDNLTRLKASAGAAGVSIATDLLPSLTKTSDRVRELMDDDKGVQALVRAFAGLGKIPFDLIFGDIAAATTAQGRIKELKDELNGLQRDLKSSQTGGGKSSLVMRSIFGTPDEINQQITVIKNQIATLEKFGDKVYKPKEKPKSETETKTKTTTTSGSKADPLASLLGQTDIVKMQEFDKTVAMLNQRFDYGRKNTDLYAQAMTKLVETTFSSNFDEFNKQQADLADIEKDVAAHLKATKDELKAQEQAWIDAGAAIEEEYKPGLQKLEDRLAYLDELFRRNLISADALSAGYADAFDTIGQSTKTAATEMDVFAKKAAENIQQSFADFLFDPFDKGMKGMLQGFGGMVKRMIADAVAADLAKSLFGDLAKGGSGDGVAGGLLKTVGGWFGFADGGIAANGRPVPLARFAGGGVSNTAAIFGEAGPEAAVPLPDGRSIPVTMKGGGGNTYVVNVSGSNNAPDVRRAAGQGMREALGMINGARRYA